MLLTICIVVAARQMGWLKKDAVDDHPTSWDPRVTSLVTFVEGARGLEFRHPVFIDFLTEAEFSALFDSPPPDAAAQQAARDATALFNAWGLAVDYDPLAGSNSSRQSTTLGFYDPTIDRLVVRGTDLTPALRVVLVHELTHALQDQHFDIELGGDGDLELRSIVEADAMRVEGMYLDTLPAADRAAAEADNTLSPEQEAELAEIPAAIVAEQYAPYLLGPLVLDIAVERGGNAAVDRLIANPPTEAELMNPRMLDRTEDATIEVAAPAGSEVIDAPQRLSAFSTLVMLDQWLPWGMARDAIEGWTGGGYTSFRSVDGRVCFTAAASFNRLPDKFSTALTWWAGASGSDAVPSAVGNRVLFTACDRGPSAANPSKPTLDTVSLLVAEHYLSEQLADESKSTGDLRPREALVDAWRCAARQVLSDESLAGAIWEPDIPQETRDRLQQGLRSAFAQCPVIIEPDTSSVSTIGAVESP